MKLFKTAIKINQDSWQEYTKNQIITIPILAEDRADVRDILSEKYDGSEYPDYSVVSIERYDTFLFPPKITNTEVPKLKIKDEYIMS